MDHTRGVCQRHIACAGGVCGRRCAGMRSAAAARCLSRRATWPPTGVRASGPCSPLTVAAITEAHLCPLSAPRRHIDLRRPQLWAQQGSRHGAGRAGPPGLQGDAGLPRARAAAGPGAAGEGRDLGLCPPPHAARRGLLPLSRRGWRVTGSLPQDAPAAWRRARAEPGAGAPLREVARCMRCVCRGVGPLPR